MIKKIFLGLMIISLSSSCVSKKVYKDLESKFADLKKENRSVLDKIDALQKEKEDLAVELSKQKADYKASQAKLDALQEAYNALEKNSNAALEANMKKNRDLLAELAQKSQALAEEQEKLNENTRKLAESSKRLADLEALIAAKEEGLKKLKETLSNALNAFEGKGLTVQQKDGKVYVSVENKLLFKTGSWAVNEEGKKAVIEVGKVLAENPDISILIEGHTDNDPYNGSGPIADNWDLSTKRATSIVNILSENKQINKGNLTAAGRSEYAPIAPNTTSDGRAKNRRTEIILTPRLDEISDLVNKI